MADTEVKPVKVVLALIPRNGSFVLIERKNPHLHLRWAFPGGKTKPEINETEEDAVVREAFEEVGLDVRVARKLIERKHPDTLVQMVYFHCELLDATQEPVVKEDYEISTVEWVPAGQVIERFTSNVDPTIREFILSFAKDSSKEVADALGAAVKEHKH